MESCRQASFTTLFQFLKRQEYFLNSEQLCKLSFGCYQQQSQRPGASVRKIGEADDEGEILFLNADIFAPTDINNKRQFNLLLLLTLLLLPACASISTSTALIPGKELSRNSLGFKETVNDLKMREVNPYTVYLRRKVCNSELLSVAYQAMKETRFETQTYDCSGADTYVNYIAHNFTALGVPLLFDSVTGFGIFKGNCLKNPPILSRIELAESKEVINKEEYDNKSASCKDIPVAGVMVKARINGDVIDVTTSAKGIASLPPQVVTEMKSVATSSSINFQYDTAEISTVYEPQKAAE